MATTPKFRIDVDIHSLLMDSSRQPAKPAAAMGLTLPEPVFPQYPEKLFDPGPEMAPEKRDWSPSHVYRAMRGWLFPYIRSRVMPAAIDHQNHFNLSSTFSEGRRDSGRIRQEASLATC